MDANANLTKIRKIRKIRGRKTKNSQGKLLALAVSF